MFDDDNDETKCAGGDYGMDFLARSLGLDINALAMKLAMDDETPVLPIQNIQVNTTQQILNACSYTSTP